MHARATWTDSIARQMTIAAAAGRNVIWDFDGTIADTEHLHEESFRAVLAVRGFHVPDDYFEVNFGGSEEAIWLTLRDVHGAPIDEIADVVAERKDVYATLAQQVEPGWLVEDLAPAFEQVGAVQYVISNGQHDTNADLIRRFGFHDLLRSVNRGTRDKSDFYPELRPAVILDDRSHYLGRGRTLGALTVGVHNNRNRGAQLGADVTVDIAA
ncbi:hypothetical protein ASF30_09525 [Leifsonia sp. Leaf264]|nr:hypothetical protein ASF30_09525 [Leifsonia sp. Leaf264]